MSTDMTLQIKSTSSEETANLGRSLGRLLKGGEVIELQSDLGGGKTTLVKGIAEGMGSTNKVASPTFTITKTYKTEALLLNHFDFYRLNNPGILSEQLRESLHNQKTVTVIEWSEIVRNQLASDRIRIKLEPLQHNQDARIIKISYPASMTELIQRLENDWAKSKP